MELCSFPSFLSYLLLISLCILVWTRRIIISEEYLRYGSLELNGDEVVPSVAVGPLVGVAVYANIRVEGWGEDTLMHTK